MKIMVCIKLVPSINNLKLDNQYRLIRNDSVQMINPADESAIEAALRLKGDGTVSIITMGKHSCEETLRFTIALGVDNAYLISDEAFAGSDTYATAKTLVEAIKKTGEYDLILCGRKAVDGETGQVPPEIAALLNIPFVTNVLKVTDEGPFLSVERLLENEIEILSVPKPALLSLCEYSYQIRLPSISGLKGANKAEVPILSNKYINIPREECGLQGSPTRVTHIAEQESGVRNVTFINSLEESIAKLNELVMKVKL